MPPGEYSTGFCFTYIGKSSLKQLFCKFWQSSQKNICNTAHSQHSCKLSSQLLQSTPSQDCLLILKNTRLEIAKTVELKNVVLLNVFIISGGYKQCDFYRIFSAAMICLPSKNFVHAQMIHFQFLVSPMTIAVETVRNNGLKGCVCYIFASLFYMSKREHL